MKTAVIYARYSCSKQREASIEDQVRVCTEWCAREGYAVVGTYCDAEMSGRTDERPQFQRMIANAGESQIVLVYMMDRFSRDPYDAPVYKHELAVHGVRLVSATESIPDSPEGIIYEKLLEGLAACESLKTSERTKRGMHGNALKCMHNGVRVFGYRFSPDGGYEVDEAEAAIVRECFERRLKGESPCSISTDMARRGVRGKTGHLVASSWVEYMIGNEKYKGVYLFGEVRIDGGMPAIVSEEVWDAAQKAPRRKTRRNENWAQYRLVGKLVCGECGRNLVGSCGYGRAGRRYDYYRCPGGDCRPVRVDWIERQIVDAVAGMLADRNTALDIARAFGESEDDRARKANIREMRKAIEDAGRKEANILAAIEQGIIPPGANSRLLELSAVKTHAEHEIERLEEQCAFDEEDFADFLQLALVDDEDSLLDCMVHSATLTRDAVEVELGYGEKDEPAKLSAPRVRRISSWLPFSLGGRILELALVDGVPVFRISRA